MSLNNPNELGEKIFGGYMTQQEPSVFRRRWIGIAALGVFCAVAGSAVAWHFFPKANMDYAAAERTNTVAAYQHFVDTYPNDPRRQSVLQRIDQMSWESAQKSNSIAEVDAYIRRFPNGSFVEDAHSLRDNLEIASLPVFEGTTSAVMGMGGGLDASGAISLDAPAILLATRTGQYQILTNKKTIFRGMQVSDAGVLWNLGRRYRVRGNLIATPNGPHVGGVQFVDARVVEQLSK